MRVTKLMTKFLSTALALALVLGLLPGASMAQDHDQAPPSFSPDQLDHLVSRIALYPDPLLAQVLAAIP